MSERAGQPTLSDTGGAVDYQVLMRVDPAAGDEFLEQRAVETARGAIVDILDQRLLAEFGMAQSGGLFLVAAVRHLAAEQQGQPFGVRQYADPRECVPNF